MDHVCDAVVRAGGKPRRGRGGLAAQRVTRCGLLRVVIEPDGGGIRRREVVALLHRDRARGAGHAQRHDDIHLVIALQREHVRACPRPIDVNRRDDVYNVALFRNMHD